MHTTLRLSLLAVLGLTACDGTDKDDEPLLQGDDTGSDGTDDGDGDGDGDGDEALGAEARALLEESLDKLVSDAYLVLSYSHDQDVAYAASLLGQTESIGGVASMFMACEEPVEYDHWCELSGDSGIPGVALCTRFACEEAGTWRSDTWWVDGDAADPTAPHELSLPSATTGDEVIWATNPMASWTITDADGEVHVSGAPDMRVAVSLASGETVDLSYTSTVEAVRDDAFQMLRFDVGATFPGVAATGSPVEVALTMDEAGDLRGAVTLDGETLATVTSHEVGVQLEWAGD